MAISKIWVFAESDGDKPTGTTLELLTKARELGGTLEAVYVGANAEALAAPLGEYGATTAYAVDPGDALPGIVGAAALESLIGEHSPDLVLFAQSYDGRDAIARLSVKLDRPVLTNGTSLRAEGDKVVVDGLQKIRAGMKVAPQLVPIEEQKEDAGGEHGAAEAGEPDAAGKADKPQ